MSTAGAERTCCTKRGAGAFGDAVIWQDGEELLRIL
jgi:hypothetical protein